jgi:hypothetical protein
MSSKWALPAPGDIVWCWFPEVPGMEPGPKPRPALVMRVACKEDGDVLSVVYGTSKNLQQLRRGEFAITRDQHPSAYALAGLAYDTKFDFKTMVELPWSERYFKVPPRSPHGNTPKLGTLHATLVRAAEAAYRAAANQ